MLNSSQAPRGEGPKKPGTTKSSAAQMVLPNIAWTKTEPRDYPLRVLIRSKVECELKARHPTRRDWQDKCTKMAAQLEEVLFKASTSLEEYANEQTISTRLEAIAMLKRPGRKQQQVPSQNLEQFSRPVATEVASHQMFVALLVKAKMDWLSPMELSIVFDHLAQVSPTNELYSNLTPDTQPLQQLTGKLFHLWAHASRDGHIWSSESASPQAQLSFAGIPIGELVLSTADGKPTIWMIRSINLSNQLERRVYPHAEHLGSVLVHYMDVSRGKPKNPVAIHFSNCLCLECKFQQNSTLEANSHWLDSSASSSSFSRNNSHVLVSSTTSTSTRLGPSTNPHPFQQPPTLFPWSAPDVGFQLSPPVSSPSSSALPLGFPVWSHEATQSDLSTYGFYPNPPISSATCEPTVQTIPARVPLRRVAPTSSTDEVPSLSLEASQSTKRAKYSQ